MKQGDDLLLEVRLQVDKQVAAADQIELGKGSVADQVLDGKDDRLAQRLGDLVIMVIELGEKSAKQIGWHVGGDAFRVDPAAGIFQGFLLRVGVRPLDGD